MNYKVVDMDKYYRKGIYRHFSQDCKCSVSITSRIDVTELYSYSKKTGTKFYINFLYILSKVLNSREDYRMGYKYETDEVIIYDKINPAHYVFFDEKEICTPVYTEYDPEYRVFYKSCEDDIKKAKESREYVLESADHLNWFDASYISWLSYDSLNVELPDGYLYFIPIVNWGRFRKEDDRLMMPVSVRMNHATADGYLVSKVFLLLQKEIDAFVSK